MKSGFPKPFGRMPWQTIPHKNEKITAFLRAKVTDPGDTQAVKRAVNALLRRGHSYGAIRQALNNLSLDSDDFPEDE